MNNLKDTLIEILDIIGFAGDKDNFVEKFFNTLYLQLSTSLITSLPLERQTEITQKITDDPENSLVVLKKYFGNQQIGTLLEETTKEAFTGFFRSVEPTLSVAQKEKLAQLFKKLSSLITP